MSRPCQPESGPSASDLRGPDGGLHDVLVQVREHLPDAVQILVGEQDDRYGVLADLRIVHQSSSDAGASVLAVIDDQLVS
jgi:hypothetical protein